MGKAGGKCATGAVSQFMAQDRQIQPRRQARGDLTRPIGAAVVDDDESRRDVRRQVCRYLPHRRDERRQIGSLVQHGNEDVERTRIVHTDHYTVDVAIPS